MDDEQSNAIYIKRTSEKENGQGGFDIRKELLLYASGYQ
jgi:hypothetical protein